MTEDQIARPARLDWRTRILLYGYGFFDGLILIYPVYLLYFRDQGLSETEIATLLMLWPISSLLFELPLSWPRRG